MQFLCKKFRKNTTLYFFGWQLQAFYLNSDLPTVLVLALYEDKKEWDEIQFLLVNPLQGTLIEVNKGLAAIGAGDEMTGDSTQKDSV